MCFLLKFLSILSSRFLIKECLIKKSVFNSVLFPYLFRGNSFNAPATTDNKERNQSEEKTLPDTDYPEPLDPASLKKIAHMEDSKKLNLLKFKWKPEENFKFPSRKLTTLQSLVGV